MFHLSVAEDLEIRLFEERHIPEIFGAVERNREHLRRWLPWVDRTQSPEDVRVFLEHALAAFGRGEELHAGIWIGRQLAGAVGHHKMDEANRSTSIGYWLDAAAEGKGVMTRCCRTL